MPPTSFPRHVCARIADQISQGVPNYKGVFIGTASFGRIVLCFLVTRGFRSWMALGNSTRKALRDLSASPANCARQPRSVWRPLASPCALAQVPRVHIWHGRAEGERPAEVVACRDGVTYARAPAPEQGSGSPMLVVHSQCAIPTDRI